MILLIDNYDSFTYNLSQYIRQLGRDVRTLRNDAVDAAAVERLAPELIVISPGPGGPESSGNCLALLRAFAGRVPVLGVCLGMQIVARHFGATIRRAREPVHGKTRLVHHDGLGLFRGLPQPLLVTRYHSLAVEESSLPEELEVTARADDGEIMGLQHRSYPISGVQFHPEAYLTVGGLALLRNALPETP